MCGVSDSRLGATRATSRRPYDGAVGRTPGALRRAVATAIGVLLAGVAAVAFPATAAAAPTVALEITGITITGSQPSDEIEVRGRVSNPAGSLVYGVRIALWRSRDPIDELDGLRRVSTAPPWGVILPGGYDKITEQSDAFPAGATADFAVRATLAELGFDSPGHAYAIGVRALGTADGAGSFGNVGQTVTVVAVPGDQPVPVTRLVMLTAPPTKLTPGVFRNEDLAGELKGRLDTLLTAAEQPGMSWLIDPALFDEVADMASGYQVRRDGELVAGTGQAVAAGWLSRLLALDPRSGARTLFGNPDLTGAALAGDTDVLARSLAATARVSRLNHLPLVLVPTGAGYTPELAAYLSGTEADAVLARNLLTAGAWQTTAEGRPVLASAVSLDPAPATLAATQSVLAETVVAGARGQLRILDDPSDLAADAATTTDWMTPRPLGEVLAGTPTGLAAFAPVAPATLAPDRFGEVADLEQDFAAYAQLVPDSTLPDEAAGLLSRAVSAAWVDDPSGRDGMLSAIDELVGREAMANAVSLDASPRFVMSSRTNQFPLTLVNHLDEAIRVKVVIDTDNPQRVTVPDTPLITIPARESASVTVQPEASGNGVAVARAWVTTEGGRRVTPSTRIIIEMTDLGFIGWVIVVTSGAVVLGATALRVRQVRRRPAPEVSDSPDEADAPPDASTDPDRVGAEPANG